MQYNVLHCTSVLCILLHCTALHCIALHCIALHCIALHCTELYCTVLPCTALQDTKEKSCIRETLKLSTDADSSTDIFVSPGVKTGFFFFHILHSTLPREYRG